MIVNRNILLGAVVLVLVIFVGVNLIRYNPSKPDVTAQPERRDSREYKSLEEKISQLYESQSSLMSQVESGLEKVQSQLQKIQPGQQQQAPPQVQQCPASPNDLAVRLREQRIRQLEARIGLHEKLGNIEERCTPLFKQYPNHLPPHADPKGSGAQQKAQEMINYAKEFGIKNWVETGTYEGGTTQMMLPHFNKIYSIEMADVYYNNAVNKFRDQIDAGKVKLLKGDSATKLKEIVKELDGPALFWLDGHWSGGDTAMGTMDTPIFDEIMTVFNDFKYAKDSVIFIDDARLFKGYSPDVRELYPNIRELLEFLCIYSPWGTAEVKPIEFKIEMDMMRIHKRK